MTAFHTGIAVLEGKWWKNSNISVRSMFDLVSELAAENPHAYHYEMANSLPAIYEAIPRIMRIPKCKYLCIATHGDAGKLSLFNNDCLSTHDLRTILIDAERSRGRKSRCVGLYLSSCLVGTLEIARFMFEREIGLTWIAGYTKEIDWLQSAAMDMLFFSELVYAEKSSRKKTIRDVSERLKINAQGLIEELGFGIYIQSRRHGGAQNLLMDASEEEI